MPRPQRPQWQTATNFLILINVAVFALMVFKDSSALMTPSNEQLIRWGADFGPLTLDKEFWRMLTSGFLHIGIIHIAVNMWSLWILGRLAERFVGGASLIAIYLLTGLGASLASLAWDPIRVSAGASGPIFGFVGAMIGVLYFSKSRLDPAQRKSLLGYVVRIAAINLFIGLKSGIDNMAHFGGMVTGLAIGSLLALTARNPSSDKVAMRRNIFIGALAALAVLFIPVRAAKHSVVYGYQGSMALERKDFSTAIANFQRYTEEEPSDASGHAALGAAFQADKKYPQALEAYKRSLAIKPEQPDVQINIAAIYAAQGMTREAIDLFTANLGKVKMDEESYAAFGEALIQNGEGERAENMLRNAIKLDANIPETHAALARALLLQKKTQEAADENKIADDLRKKAAVTSK